MPEGGYGNRSTILLTALLWRGATGVVGVAGCLWSVMDTGRVGERGACNANLDVVGGPRNG
jgi:hypothetical protein